MIPAFSAVGLDGVPDDQREWTERWAKSLNGMNSSVLRLLSGGVSLSENSNTRYVKIRVAGGSFPQQFNVGLPPSGILVANVVDVDAPTNPVPVSQVQWIPKGDQVLVRNVTGLLKGRKYDLTLLVLFDKPSATTPGAGLASNTSADPMGWITPSRLESGAANYTAFSDFELAGYRKDQNGVVWLKGIVVIATANVPIFTLPAQYRPRKAKIFASYSDTGAARVDVLANGRVQKVAGGNAYLSLDMINFLAEQ